VRILIPLPDRDFDVTEVAVPWRILRDAGHEVVFATERKGTVPAADPRLLTGVLFGQLGAAPEARDWYGDMVKAPEFTSTEAWDELDPAGFDGLLLPGGHAPGMRQYLGSAVLSEQVGRFWQLKRPVGAICHGVLVLARTRDAGSGRGVLATRQTTCLPKYMERSAYLATAWRLGRYYRTYHAYVEDEVKASLDDPARQFQRGPLTLSARGTAADDSPAFVVRDANYLSARWPGDAYLFARSFLDLLSPASLRAVVVTPLSPHPLRDRGAGAGVRAAACSCPRKGRGCGAGVGIPRHRRRRPRRRRPRRCLRAAAWAPRAPASGACTRRACRAAP
jgi:putative intracellular protease/amidase